jgi:N6-adenosine-specific RNA methylase IME4
MEQRNVKDICKNGRHRKDLGDLVQLAKSIDEIGLLHPVVINASNTLIAGERRLEACKILGWQKIPVRVIDLENIVRGEHDENVLRKDFTPSEAVAISMALEPMEREAAKERMLAGRPSEKFTEGQAMDKVASAVGMSRPTLQRAKEVVEAAERDPETFGPIVEKMDKTGNVSAAFQEMRRYEQAVRLDSIELKEAKAIEGVYDVIVIDPPWQMEKIEREVAPNQVAFDYPTMTLEEISRLDIPAADNCHVWLWTTQKYLPHAFGLFAAWNVKYVCTFNWHKAGGFQPFGLPQYNNEFVLYGRIGAPSFVETKDFKTSFEGKRGGHSEKPGEFYDTVRRVTAGRRLDMFNRRKIEGFDGWGKEAGQ